MAKKLRALGALVRSLDTRTVRPPPSPPTPQQRFKKADPIYASVEYRAWRAAVVNRAGGRCEARDRYGNRCSKTERQTRMFADHRDEISDGGAPFDVANGQCLCGPHHLMKTAQARRDRLERHRGGLEMYGIAEQ